MNDVDLGGLWRQAAGGDEQAWSGLAERFADLVWAIVRGHGFNQADSAEISRATWLGLAEHLSLISPPQRLGAWLATRARQECLRMSERQKRDTEVEQRADRMPGDRAPGRTEVVVGHVPAAALWEEFETLAPASRALLRVLRVDRPLSYADLSGVFEMPVGGIGPVRARSLDRLSDRTTLRPPDSQRRRQGAGTTSGRAT